MSTEKPSRNSRKAEASGSEAEQPYKDYAELFKPSEKEKEKAGARIPVK